MTVVVCDDNVGEAEHIAKQIRDYDGQIRLITHTNPEDTIEYINKHPKVELCILDIIMPEINGVEVAQNLRQSGYEGEIVFLTTSNNYAFESYEVKAFQYILKPYTSDKLFKLLHEVNKKKIAEDSSGIIIKTHDETRFVPHRNIIYAEAQLRKVIIHLNNGQALDFTSKFGDVSKQLQNDKRFVLCHRSYIVNMSYISTIVGKVMELRSGVRIPISSTYIDVKSKYMHFVLEESNG